MSSEDFLTNIKGKTKVNLYLIRNENICVVVVLLFYVHGKHLTTLFLGRLRPPKRLTSTSCTYFRQ